MVPGTVYLTPTDLLSRAPLGSITRAEVPGPAHAGRIINFMPAAGPGVISLGGYPIDDVDFALRVVGTGEIGDVSFELSSDGGVTFGNAILTTPNEYQNQRWEYELGPYGVIITAENAVAGPSFLDGQVWTWSTTASPKILQVCRSISALFRKWALNQGQPIDDIDEADAQFLAHVGRYWLCSDRGKMPEEWVALYQEAMRHFKLEANGDLKLGSVPDPDGFTFPDYETNRPPFRGVWRH